MTLGPLPLFTVTYDGVPIALVRSQDFAGACHVAARVLAIAKARDEDHLATVAPGPSVSFDVGKYGKLRARRPTDGERYRWTVACQRFGVGGEAALAAVAL